jgi:hypothetical protein
VAICVDFAPVSEKNLSENRELAPSLLLYIIIATALEEMNCPKDREIRLNTDLQDLSSETVSQPILQWLQRDSSMDVM